MTEWSRSSCSFVLTRRILIASKKQHRLHRLWFPRFDDALYHADSSCGYWGRRFAVKLPDDWENIRQRNHCSAGVTGVIAPTVPHVLEPRVRGKC